MSDTPRPRRVMERADALLSEAWAEKMAAVSGPEEIQRLLVASAQRFLDVSKEIQSLLASLPDAPTPDAIAKQEQDVETLNEIAGWLRSLDYTNDATADQAENYACDLEILASLPDAPTPKGMTKDEEQKWIDHIFKSGFDAGVAYSAKHDGDTR